MSADPTARTPEALTAVEAGEVLSLPADVVRALADAGYLPPSEVVRGVPRFATDELKAFQARAASGGADPGSWSDPFGGIDADELVTALEGRSTDIAERALHVLAAVYPRAAAYDDGQRALFVSEAVHRIDGIIALCARGPEGVTDVEELEEALAGIGADAAGVGVPLSQLLVTLRVSRDLVVQTAIELAEERGRHWGLALAVVLTRALPAVDRLTDAVAGGYWEAALEIEAESLDRFRNILEQSDDAMFELDDRGTIGLSNKAFGELVGRDRAGLRGTSIHDVLPDLDLTAPESTITVAGETLPVRRLERIRDGVIAGWDIVVRI